MRAMSAMSVLSFSKPFLAALLVNLLSLTSSSKSLESFVLTTMTSPSSNNEALCAEETPSATFAVPTGGDTNASCVPGSARCGWRCGLDPSCSAFNYIGETGECELYDVLPLTCAVVPGCQLFQVRD